MSAELATPDPPQELTPASNAGYLLVARHALREIDQYPVPRRIPMLRRLMGGAEVMRVANRKAALDEDSKAANRQAALSEAAALDWEEFKADAERVAGQLLASLRDQGLRAAPDSGRPKAQHDDTHSAPTLVDLGVAEEPRKARVRASRWEAIASLPDDMYESFKEDGRAAGQITQARGIKLAKQWQAAQAAPPAGQPLPVPDGTFSCIVADPPWQYGNTSTRGAAQDHYQTMTIEELCNLDVAREHAADQAHLYLWTTAGHLPEAFKVMEAWGFTYKTYLVWVKPQMGMGNYFRISTELVLFGIKGGLRTQDMGLLNYFTQKRGRHSAKPSKFYDLVCKASRGPYLEMFARCDAANQLEDTCQCSKCRLGWEVWGNQA